MSSESPNAAPSEEPNPDSSPQASAPEASAPTGSGAEPAEASKPSSEADATAAQVDSSKPVDAASSKSEADAPKKPEKKKKPKRTWGQRLRLTVFVVLFAALAVRVVLWAALPVVLHKTAAFYDLDLNYERLSFSALDGEVAIWHLTVAPKGGGETIAATDYVHGQISVMNLLRGRLDVWRMEADGVDLAVTRNADGKVPLIERFISESTAPKKAATPAGEIDLTPPAAIDAFRLQHVRAHVRDFSVSPPLDTVTALDLRVSDVGSALRPTQFEVDVSSDPVLDSLHVEGEGRAAGATLNADVQIRVRGLHGKAAVGYLAPLGLQPVADSIDMKMTGRVQVAPAGQLPAPPPAGQALATQPAVAAPATAPAARPAGPADALAARLELLNIVVVADEQETAGVDKVTIVADTLTPGLVDIGTVSVDGVRCRAYRDSAGIFHAAGMKYAPAPASEVSSHPAAKVGAPPAAGSASAGGSASAAAGQAAPAFKWSVGELAVRNVKATFTDQAVKPVGELAFDVDQFFVRNLVADPARPDAELSIAGQFNAPGMARSIRIDGKAKPFALTKTVSLAVRAQGVKPDAIRQYLALIGVESQLKDASFACDLQGSASIADGQTGADLNLTNVSFDDGQQLLGLNGVRVDGIRLDPARNLYHVDSIEVSGPALAAQRESSGTLSGLGFRLNPQQLLQWMKGPAASAETPGSQSRSQGEPGHQLPGKIATPPSSSVAVASLVTPPGAVQLALATPAAGSGLAPAAPTSPAKILPRVEIDKLVWKDVKVTFDDQEVAPGSAITFSDAGLELNKIRFDMNDSKPAEPGTFKAWLAAPGIADRLGVEGTVTPGANAISLDMNVIGRGLAAGILAPYVKGLGVTPTLHNGSLDLHAKIDLKNTDDGFTSDLAVTGVRYAEGEYELAGVDALHVEGLTIAGKSSATIDSIEIDRPRAAVARDADGSLLVGGVRIAIPLPASAAAPANPPKEKSAAVVMSLSPTTVPATAPATAPTTGPASAPAQASPPFVTVLNKLRIHDGTLSWADIAVKPVASTKLVASVDLDHFTFGKPADPATLHITAKANNSLDNATVDGTVSATASSAAAKLEVKAAGLRAGTLAPYIPPSIVVSLKDGRFHANIDAAFNLLDDGSQSGHLLVDSLDYREGESATPLLKMGSAAVRVSRADLGGDKPNQVLAVDEISVTGLETSAEKSPDGSLRLLGLSMGGPQPATKPTTIPLATVLPPATTEPAVAAVPAGATVEPAAKPAAPVGTPAPALGGTPAPAPANVAEIIAKSHKALPLITVEKLDLNVSRASFTDASRPGSAPLVVSDLHVRNLERIALLGPTPATQPATKIELTCKADPVVGAIKVDTQIAPFADDPTLQVDVLASGIHGDGLTALAPELKDQIDGSGLTDGRFATKIEASAKLDRRSPIDFDPQRPFELDFDVTNIEFRAAPDGPVLVGVEEIRTEGARIRPATGDVLVHSLEITKPNARILRDKDGIRALGLLYKMPAPGTATTQPATKPTTPAANPATPASVAQSGKAAPSGQPSAAAPSAAPVKPANEMRIDKIIVSGLDVLVEDQSVDPAFVLPLKDMELEVLGLSNLDVYENKPIRFDMTVNAGKVQLPKKNGSGTEMRDLFAQVAASGRVFLYPDYEGWAKASVSGFELASLAGEAKQFKMKLSGGTFDEAVDVRFKNGSMEARTKTVMTDLAYEEPANGPIQTLFKLGAPVNIAIAAVQDADGSITLPVNVPVPKGHVDQAAVIGSATGAVGLVLTTAIASAPIKVVNLVGSMLGGEKKKEPEKPVVLSFPAGSTALEPAASGALAGVIERLKKEKGLEIQLKQELGGGDVDLSQKRANPSMQECTALVYQNHQRKLELERLHSQVAGRARGLYASRADAEAAATLVQLHTIDRELSQTEDALDKLYDLLRPGADRQADRRTRSASLDVAWGRLDTVRAALVASGIPDIDKRIQKYSAQFNPAGTGGGTVTLLLVPTKK